MHEFLRLLHRLFGHREIREPGHLAISFLFNNIFIRGHRMHVKAANGQSFTLHIGGLTAAGIQTDNLPAGAIPTLSVDNPAVLSLSDPTPDPTDPKKFTVQVTMLADSGDAVITANDAGLTGSIRVTATPALAVALDVEADSPAVTVIDGPDHGVSAPAADAATATTGDNSSTVDSTTITTGDVGSVDTVVAGGTDTVSGGDSAAVDSTAGAQGADTAAASGEGATTGAADSVASGSADTTAAAAGADTVTGAADAGAVDGAGQDSAAAATGADTTGASTAPSDAVSTTIVDTSGARTEAP